MRLDQEDTQAFNTLLKSVKYSFTRKVASSDVFITQNGSIVNAIDSNGGTRNVWLPPNEPGRFYVVGNIGTSGTLVLKDALGVEINQLSPGETATLFSGATSWVGTNTPLNLDVFGYTGPDHSEGLVPDPGIGPVSPDPALRRYLSELGWSTIASGVEPGTNFFYSMKGGAVTLTPLGTESLEFLSANTAITVLGRAGTSPKSILFTLNAANINHDALLNYSADRHVAHSSVDLVAGLGISGGGTIAASRTFDFNPSELAQIELSTDKFFVTEVPSVGPRRSPVSGMAAVIDHNALINYVADQHVAHSGVSIVASTGLSGGGNITTSRSLALAIDSLTTDVPAVNDVIPFFDVSGGDHNKATFTTLNGIMDHNALLNYDPLKHFSDVAMDGLAYVRKNRAWVESEVLSNGYLFNYMFNAATATPPASGSIRLNNVTQSGATVMWFNYTTNDTIAVNLKTFFTQRVEIGDTLYLQDKDDPTKWQLYRISAPYTDAGTYASIPVLWLAGGSALTAGRIVISREGATVSNPIGEAPQDSTTYGRENAAWVRIPTITVGTTAPSSPAVNDVWIDTN